MFAKRKGWQKKSCELVTTRTGCYREIRIILLPINIASEVNVLMADSDKINIIIQYKVNAGGRTLPTMEGMSR